MQPYMMPPPPQKSGTNVALIVGIVVVVVVVIPFFILFGFGVLGYMHARSSARAARTAAMAATATPASLTESYPTKNGTVVAHYPPEFAAKSLDNATVVLSKNLADGTDEAVQVACVPNPISDDVNEFSRVLVTAMIKNITATGDTWTETARRRRPCFRSFPGLEIEGTFTAHHRTKENVRICFFMDSDRGYELKSIVPEMHEGTELATLQSIIAATEIK